MTDIQVTIPDVETEPYDDIELAIEQVVASALEEANIGYDGLIGAEKHWSGGQGCPHCGAEYIREVHMQGEIAHHNDGVSSFVASMDRLATLQYQCDECERVLSELDLSDIARVLPTDQDDE